MPLCQGAWFMLIMRIRSSSKTIRSLSQSVMESPATSNVPGVFKSLPSITTYLERHRETPEVDELLQLYEQEAQNQFPHQNLYPLIVFEGLDGSGKSLASKLTAKKLKGIKTSTPPEIIKPLRAYFDGPGVDSVLRRAFYSLGNYIAAIQMRKALQDSPVVVDRFWHSTAANAIAELNDSKQLHDEVFGWPNDLLKPQLAVFLTVPENVRLERMSRRKNFSAEEDQLRESASYRILLTETFKKMHSPSLKFISSDGPPNRVVSEVLQLLEQIREEKST